MAETLTTRNSALSTADLRRSPAAHLAERFAEAEVTGPYGVSLREVPFLTMVGLRVAPGSEAAHRVEARLGTPLPARVGEVGIGTGCSVLWLSPDEFLVVSAANPTEFTARLVQALGSEPGSAVDLSANRTTFELAGRAARDLLEKGCPLDLHPRAFAVGAAYATQLGPVPIILWKTGPETYEIYPRASFADYLGRWLLDAMAEFRALELL
ncbi:sarcosine oxidase subunit gamma family protein [Sinomonas sp. JGH33]|uniref:Sarcosine oxidase subunit gamma family protein n=1 Tax=Sinomonas terricola TaxID=3110330 RepID=A0ABU5T2H7_9MICC|nr:sarcosine oxidase subunit gamma family protein [Sinomonas sp. JGH33]MEA5453859.1 sarcosine oxidase subunit gamma family protein [Sinomonas sp. JGH33]